MHHTYFQWGGGIVVNILHKVGIKGASSNAVYSALSIVDGLSVSKTARAHPLLMTSNSTIGSSGS